MTQEEFEAFKKNEGHRLSKALGAAKLLGIDGYVLVDEHRREDICHYNNFIGEKLIEAHEMLKDRLKA